MNDAKFQKLFNANPPMTLVKQSRTTSLLMVLVWFVFCTVSLVANGHHSPLPGTAIVMLCGFLAGIRSLWRSLWLAFFPNSDSLTITPQHFTIRNVGLFRSLCSLFPKRQALIDLEPGKTERIRFIGNASYEWKDVTPFVITSAATKRKFAAFDDIAGQHHVFPIHNYRLTPEQLAQLMNQWRERALAAQHSTT